MIFTSIISFKFITILLSSIQSIQVFILRIFFPKSFMVAETWAILSKCSFHHSQSFLFQIIKHKLIIIIILCINSISTILHVSLKMFIIQGMFSSIFFSWPNIVSLFFQVYPCKSSLSLQICLC